MFGKDLVGGRQPGDDFAAGGGAGDNAGNNAGVNAGGDGLHHHQIDEDEGGGYHSVHTNPDGTKEQADHVDYNEAKSAMDDAFGCGDMSDGGDDDSSDAAPSMADSADMNDIAGSYGRKAAQKS